MAQIKPQKFLTESFPKQAEWIGTLFSSLNQFINDVFIAFNNQITISENLFQEIKEVTVKNQSGSFPILFKCKFASNPRGMQLIYIYDNSLSKCATQFPVVEWKYQNGNIQITNLSGLTSGTSYTMRFLVIYG